MLIGCFWTHMQGASLFRKSPFTGESKTGKFSKRPTLTFLLGTLLSDKESCGPLESAFGAISGLMTLCFFLAFFFHLNPLQVSMGALGMGFVTTYLPEALISAYLAAVALHIMMSELTSVLGIVISFHSGPISFFYVSNFTPHPAPGLQRQVDQVNKLLPFPKRRCGWEAAQSRKP